jgi:hypothetical protein
MYYATFDAQGNRITSFLSGVHKNIPEEAILISDEDQATYASGEYIRDNGTGKPIKKTVTLSTVITKKLAELKAARNSAESATPFVYDGSSFDYDSLSRERINAAISGATIAAISGISTSTVVAEWTLQDNAKRNMTIADWLAFRQAEITRSGSCHTHYNALKTDIEAIVEETTATPPTKTEADAIVAINAIAWA